MIIEIEAGTYQGKTSTAIKLMNTFERTYIVSMDGDFENVYHRMNGKSIYDGFHEEIVIHKIDDDNTVTNLINGFFNSDDYDTLVLDCDVHEYTLNRLKNMIRDTDRNLIVTKREIIGIKK